MADACYVFQACGFASWLVLFLAMLTTGLSMVALVVVLARSRASRIIARIAFLASLLPLTAGAYGRTSGRSKVDSVLRSGMIEPAYSERIRVEGYREADGCVLVGAVAGAFPLFLGFVAVILGIVRPPRTSPDPG